MGAMPIEDQLPQADNVGHYLVTGIGYVIQRTAVVIVGLLGGTIKISPMRNV